MKDLADAYKQIVELEAQIARLKQTMFETKLLLKRVFGDGCVFTGSVLGPIGDCLIADANKPWCNMSNEDIPLDGTRPDWCPYLPFEVKE